jgi:hypothetical protein
MAEAQNIPASGGIPQLPITATNVNQGSGQGSTPAVQAPTPQASQPIVFPGQVPGMVQPTQQAQVPELNSAEAAEFAAFKAYQAQQRANAAPQNATPVLTTPTAALQGVANTQDPVISSLTSIFTSTGAGIDINRALGHALTTGDANFIDVAYIREKGGANAENLVNVAKGIVGRVQEAATQAQASAHQIAGSPENWANAVAAFNASAPEHMKTVVRTLLDSGNPQNANAAIASVVDYAKSSGVVPVAGQRIQGGAQVPTGAGLSKVEFQAELRKINPNSPTAMQERGALFERRAAGKAQGRN